MDEPGSRIVDLHVRRWLQQGLRSSRGVMKTSCVCIGSLFESNPFAQSRDPCILTPHAAEGEQDSTNARCSQFVVIRHDKDQCMADDVLESMSRHDEAYLL